MERVHHSSVQGPLPPAITGDTRTNTFISTAWAASFCGSHISTAHCKSEGDVYWLNWNPCCVGGRQNLDQYPLSFINFTQPHDLFLSFKTEQPDIVFPSISAKQVVKILLVCIQTSFYYRSIELGEMPDYKYIAYSWKFPPLSCFFFSSTAVKKKENPCWKIYTGRIEHWRKIAMSAHNRRNYLEWENFLHCTPSSLQSCLI